MKKILLKFTSIICLLSLLIFSFSFTVMAKDNSGFVNLSISGYDENGNEKIDKNNIFFIKNNTLYAPIEIFNKYTMYNYDGANSAFVRVGQSYKKSNSKVIIDYKNKTARVLFPTINVKKYNIDIYKFADTYFFPLDQMAAYLKSSVVYKDKSTISIVSSGISICDALYDFSFTNSSLDYNKILDNLFCNREDLMEAYIVIGYLSNTIFSFRLSNLVYKLSDYNDYCKIIENSITNTDPYENVLDTSSFFKKLSGNANQFYNTVYKKANKMYKLSSNSLVTMFEDYKSINSFGDDSPYDNFFPDEQIEIDKINSISKKVKRVDQFLEVADYMHNYFNINADNRNALSLAYNNSEYDSRGLSIKTIYHKYGKDFLDASLTQLTNNIAKKAAESAIKKRASSLLAGVNKVKLATSIVNETFKLFGYDLSENSTVDALSASDLSLYITNMCNPDNCEKKINTENLRLTAIIVLLVNIEGYKSGNKIAKRISRDDTNHFKSTIADYTKRLGLLYLAKDSIEYESVEGIDKIASQNKKQLTKIINHPNFISNENAFRLLKKCTEDNEIQNNLNANSRFCLDDKYYYYFSGDYIDGQYYTDGYIIKENIKTGKKKKIYYTSDEISNLSVYRDNLYFLESTNLVQINTNGENKHIIDSFEYAYGKYIINENKIYTFGARDYTINDYMGGCLICIDLNKPDEMTTLFYYGSAYYRAGVSEESPLSQITVLDSVIIIDDMLYFSWSASMDKNYGIGCVSLNDNTHDAAYFDFYFDTTKDKMQYDNNRIYSVSNESLFYFDISNKTWSSFKLPIDPLNDTIYDYYITNDKLYLFLRDKILEINTESQSVINEVALSQYYNDNESESYGYFCDSVIYNGYCYVNIGKFEYGPSDGTGPDIIKGKHKSIVPLSKYS